MAKTVYLHQANRIWKLPNASVFCTKVEFFLRAAKIPYEVKAFNPNEAPRGKMPYLNIDSKLISDSENIISQVSKDHSLDFDSHLSNEQKNLSHIIRRMLEEGTYFALFWNRWGKKENWDHLRPLFFSFLPPIIRNIVPMMVRRQVKKACHGQGIARYTPQETSAFVTKDFECIKQLMDKDGPYFFGEKISRIDFTIYAFVGTLVGSQIPSPIQCSLSKDPLFQKYAKHIDKEYFSDLTQT